MIPNLTTIILLGAVRWIAHIRYWRAAAAELPHCARSIELHKDFVRWSRAKWQAWHSLTDSERLRISGRMTFQELAEEDRKARGLELAAVSPMLALAADTPAAWAHEALGAAFELFNKVWPVAGLLLCVALLVLVVLVFLSLVDACRHGPGSGWGEAYKGEGEPDDE